MHHHDGHATFLFASLAGYLDSLAHHGPTILSLVALSCTLISTGCTVLRTRIDLDARARKHDYASPAEALRDLHRAHRPR